METILLIIAAGTALFYLYEGFRDNDFPSKAIGAALGIGVVVYLTSIEVQTFVNETIRSTKGCTEWYAEEMYDAAKDEDIDRFKSLKHCVNEWIIDFDSTEETEFYESMMKWASKNAYKVGVLTDFEYRYNL